MDLDALDKRLLNLLQWEFPLEARPFEALGEKLGIAGEEVIARSARLKEAGIIRQLSAIFDTVNLGYSSSLVAFRADPARLDAVAEVVNVHPGVSHNYKRDHDYNLWFTLAVPPGKDLAAEVERLRRESGAEKALLLPTLRLFKIGVALDMTGERDVAERGEGPSFSRRGEVHPLSEREIQAIRELQEDLPLVERPFLAMAERLGMTEEGLLDLVRAFLERGQLRRVAAILRHRQAGFTSNAMAVWRVPPERIEEMGSVMASFRAVSHCYQRPVSEEWPYALFTMIHGRTPGECQTVVGEIARATGLTDYRLLYSGKEYKKERVKYFLEA